MLKINYRIIGIGFFMGLFLFAKAQTTGQHGVSLTIPPITILDIEPGTSTITLSLAPPSEAGNSVAVPAGDNSKWINYTCALPPNGTNKKIYAQVTNGTVPPGIDLKLSASNYSGSGSGTFGVPAGQISLNNTSKLLISGIGGCFTGNGLNNGHQLTYSLAINSYALVKFNNSATLQVTFTITD